MKTLNYNSGTNQNIKQKFVSIHVYLCLSYWMQDYQENNECWFEEFENMFITDEQEALDAGFDSLEEMQESGQDIQEPLEYWAVSEYLYIQLKEKGQPVAEINNTYIWGRTCSGQAILLDYVISEICSEMEILENQKYAWKE